MTFFDNVVSRWKEWRIRRQQANAVTDVVEQLRERDRESALRDRIRREIRDDVRIRREQDRDRRRY
jgi:hypothetical protein